MSGLEAEDGKSGYDSRSQTKPKRKEPIKVDINITVVPKSKKVSASSWTTHSNIHNTLLKHFVEPFSEQSVVANNKTKKTFYFSDMGFKSSFFIAKFTTYQILEERGYFSIDQPQFFQ